MGRSLAVNLGWRALSLLEMCGVMAIYFWGIWRVGPALAQDGGALGPWVGGLFMATAVYAAVISPLVVHRDCGPPRGLGSWRRFFLRTDNLGRALAVYGSFTSAALALIVAAALATGRFSPLTFDWDALGRRFFLYIFSALGQQLFIFGFFYPRLTCLLYGGRTFNGDHLDADACRRPFAQARFCQGLTDRELLCAGWLGLVAALFHYPNTTLMLGVFFAAALWSLVYRNVPNIWISALSHAAIGASLNLILGVNTRIGPSFGSNYRGFFRTVFPFLEQVINGKF